MWVTPPETLQNRDVLEEPTGKYSRRVYVGVTHSAAIGYHKTLTMHAYVLLKLDSSGSLLNDRRDTGTFFLGRATSTSMCSLCRRRPVGSRSQEEGTRIPA